MHYPQIARYDNMYVYIDIFKARLVAVFYFFYRHLKIFPEYLPSIRVLKNILVI